MLTIALFTMLLFGILFAISVVDINEMRIPDVLNGLLLTGGLAFWLLSSRGELPVQIGCATALAFAFWLIRFTHSRMTGRIGLGLGDVKMAGAGAVWINPLLLPLFVFAASACALFYALLIAKHDTAERLPFAPFLSIGLISCWMTEYFL